MCIRDRAWFNGPHAPKQHRQEGREMRSFESREDYLEAILVLQNEKGAVRKARLLFYIRGKIGLYKKAKKCYNQRED